jgi:hypothetical protein
MNYGPRKVLQEDVNALDVDLVQGVAKHPRADTRATNHGQVIE